MLFQWEGRDSTGKRKHGQMEAINLNAARQQLAQQNIEVTHIRAVRSEAPSDIRLGLKSLVLFTQQLASLQRSGLPLAQTLRMMEADCQGPLADIVKRLRRDLEAGFTLSDAMEDFPLTFDAVYRTLVRAGEEGGTLEQQLRHLATQTEHTLAWRKQLFSEMTQPALTLLIAIAVITLVLPGFATLGTALVGTALALGVRHLYIASPSWRDRLTDFMLNVPVLGLLLNKRALARWCRTLGSLYAAGVPAAEAVRHANAALGVPAYRAALHAMQREVASGNSITDAIRKASIFPHLVRSMVSSGESGGELDDMLHRAAAILDDEVLHLTRRLMTVSKIIVTILLGILVFFAMKQAMFGRLEMIDRL